MKRSDEDRFSAKLVQTAWHGYVAGARPVKRRVAGVLAVSVCAALWLTLPALAARAPRITAHYWKIIIDGQNHAVRPGGTISYCASQAVEGIVPEVVFGAVLRHIAYGFVIQGPKKAGESVVSRRGVGFPTEGALIKPKFVMSDFPSLEFRKQFPVGTYDFRLIISGKKVLTEGVTLARRADC